MRGLGAAIAAVLCVAAPVSAARPGPSRDWSRTVVATPAGGYRMGNPNAKVKLLEFGSLACSHCRHFEETGFKPLVRDYVRTGQVSYEYRNLLLNAPDVAISLLAHCAGAAKFFPMAEVVYATQPTWFDKVAAISDADRAAIEKLSTADRLVRLSTIAGFGPIAARFGVTSARAHQCLVDTKGAERLFATSKAAGDIGIHSTPTFLIDGRQSGAAEWEELEPMLRKAAAH